MEGAHKVETPRCEYLCGICDCRLPMLTASAGRIAGDTDSRRADGSRRPAAYLPAMPFCCKGGACCCTDARLPLAAGCGAHVSSSPPASTSSSARMTTLVMKHDPDYD